MRIAVQSRYTNIRGGYEEGPRHDGRPTFRRTTGGSWIFHESRAMAQKKSKESRWHFGPSLPTATGFSSFFSSVTDGPTPDVVEWPSENVDRVWQPETHVDHNASDKLSLFVDKEFPPSSISLGKIPSLAGGRKPEWIPTRRLRTGMWSLFDDGVSPNDLLQGSIGNCWLVAAMASLAEFPDAVEALFRQRTLTPEGRCEVSLYDAKKGKVTMTIDEYIPCHPREWWDAEGMPLFARPNGNEAWVLLLEKAFAKMLGSYQNLIGGNCCTAFRAFTGAPNNFVWARGEGESARIDGEWKRMQLHETDTCFVWNPATADRCDAESLWSEVRNYDRQSFLVACSMRAVHGQEYVRVDGLVEAHAYSLLHVVEVDGHRLLFLRNPWGNDKKWNGRWSDGDEAWAKHPGVRRRLRREFRDDGCFWIAWPDFQAIFDFVFVCAQPMRSAAAKAEHARRSTEADVPATPNIRVNPRRRLAEAIPERLPILLPGTRVELMGYTDQPEFNGRIAEVLSWDEDNNIYELQDVPSPYWTCPPCGEVNRRTREICNVCSGARVGIAAHAMKYCVPPERVVLPAATEVEIAGLRDFPEYNGQPGVIVAFDRFAGRYHVKLPDGIVRAIRPPHIIARKAPTEESEFARWVPPAPQPSYVDEPDPPEEVPCATDDDVRRLSEALDEKNKLRHDWETPSGVRLRRGQQLLPEGVPGGGSVADLLRGGKAKRPARLRFTRHNPFLLRFGPRGAYFDSILQLDAAIAELLLSEHVQRKLGPGLLSFLSIAAPGWAAPLMQDVPKEAHPSRRAKDGASWFCPECGHINSGDIDYCESCEA